MDLKNTAMKFFMADVPDETQEEYTGPRLLKTGHLNIVVRTPKSFADVREYADSLMNGNAVLVSFDAVDAAVMYRMFDYLNGVASIVSAGVYPLSDTLLLYTPEEVVVYEEKAAKRSGMRAWLG